MEQTSDPGSTQPEPDSSRTDRTEKTWWQRYIGFPLIWKFGIALVLGVIAGLIVGPPIATIEPLGDLFLRLLQMLVVPLVLVTLISGAASAAPSSLGRVGGKVFGFYLLTSVVAISLGLGLGLLIGPGTGLDMPSTGEDPEKAPPLIETFLNIFPENIFQALAEGNVLAVIFVAVIIGFAVGTMAYSEDARLRELAEPVKKLADAGCEVMFKIVHGVLEYGPIGVFALIAVVVGETGTDSLLPMLNLTGTVYLGIALMIVAYSLLLLAFKVNIARFFGAAKDPMLTAYVTRSSSGTLPVTMRAAEKLGIREGTYGFSLPLGATINMDGTALYVGASTLFVANVSGVDLSFVQLLEAVAVGVLASIGTAGVPGAGLIMLSLVISQAGLPFAAVALVAGVDALLDMARTMCNVTGDLVVTRIVAQTEGQVEEPSRVRKRSRSRR
ncbi:dicarboxylate/amino acid:cation symporter [Brevibacterium picturae]|uniref:Dicarboxylate/amino acid:cation symporter n=1 Tax=Brevibacterium picturae TaxID=260553 RepID=A0ABP4M4Q2_9MICO